MYDRTFLTAVQSSWIIQRSKTNGNTANVNVDTEHAIAWILQGFFRIEVAVYCWIIGNPVPTVRWKCAADLTPSTPRIRCRGRDTWYSAESSRKCSSETWNDRDFLGSTTLSLAISPLKGSRSRSELGFLSDQGCFFLFLVFCEWNLSYTLTAQNRLPILRPFLVKSIHRRPTQSKAARLLYLYNLLNLRKKKLFFSTYSSIQVKIAYPTALIYHPHSISSKLEKSKPCISSLFVEIGQHLLVKHYCIFRVLVY